MTRNVRLGLGLAVLLLGVLLFALGFDPSGPEVHEYRSCMPFGSTSTVEGGTSEPVVIAAMMFALAGVGCIISAFFGGRAEDEVAL